MFDFIKNLFNHGYFGIQITDSAIKVVQINDNTINSVITHPIPQGYVKNGEITQEKLLAEEISNTLKEADPKPITAQKCHCIIPEEQCYEQIYYFKKGIDENELKINIDHAIQESIPIPFSEIKYDYQIKEIGNTLIVFVVAVKKIIIAQYYEVLKQYCGLQPVSFEPASMSLMRNLPFNFNTEENAIIIHPIDGKIYVHAIWGNMVFDTTINSFDDCKNGQLVTDIINTMNSFKKNTNRYIHSIILCGNKEKNAVITQSLKAHITIPLKTVTQFRINNLNITDQNFNEYAVVNGTVFGDKIETIKQFNLFKKI